MVGIKIWLCKEIWIFVPIQAIEKTEKNHVLMWISFILNWKWKVCLLQPAIFFLSNSNVDNFLPDLGINPSIVYQIFRTLPWKLSKYFFKASQRQNWFVTRLKTLAVYSLQDTHYIIFTYLLRYISCRIKPITSYITFNQSNN